MMYFGMGIKDTFVIYLDFDAKTGKMNNLQKIEGTESFRNTGI